MEEWEFYRIPGTGSDDAPFLWAWQCRRSDGSMLSTPNTFRFLLDCVANARLHGYLGGPLLTRRECAYVTAPHAPGAPLRAASRI